MKYCYSYHHKEPVIHQVRAPWWLRWWRKNLLAVKDDWVRRAFFFDRPVSMSQDELIAFLDTMFEQGEVTRVQLEEASGVSQYVLGGALQTIEVMDGK